MMRIFTSKKIGTRLKDIVNKAALLPAGVSISWMTEQVRATMAQLRQDVEFKKRSERNMTNKVSGPKAGIVHSQGSVSTSVWAKRLETYEELRANTNVEISFEANDQLFFKASGGWTTKGTTYGIGNEAPALLTRPSRSSGEGGSSSYNSPVVTQLWDELHSTQTRLQSTETELHATKEELNKTRMQMKKDIANLNAKFHSFSQHIGHAFGTPDPP